MTSTERLQAMVENKPVDRIGVAGWVHMPLVDRHPIDFVKCTIDFTDSNHWDLVKVMYCGHYFIEDFGTDITFSKDPTEWSGKMNRYVVNHPMDFTKLKVQDPKKGALAREVEATKRLVGYYHGKVPVLATVFTPLTWAQELYSQGKYQRIQKAMEYNPKELEKGLEIITETNVLFLEELLKTGIDGLFYATQYGCYDIVTPEQFAHFCRPYDLQTLNTVVGKTWFNMMHIHGNAHLMFKEHADYPVQAFNWEDKNGTPDEVTTITQAREIIGKDKIIIGGIEQHHDFWNADLDRDAVKAVLKQRLLDALDEMQGSKNFIFAPGCALPLNVPAYFFHLMHEVVEEVSTGK